MYALKQLIQFKCYYVDCDGTQLHAPSPPLATHEFLSKLVEPLSKLIQMCCLTKIVNHKSFTKETALLMNHGNTTKFGLMV